MVFAYKRRARRARSDALLNESFRLRAKLFQLCWREKLTRAESFRANNFMRLFRSLRFISPLSRAALLHALPALDFAATLQNMVRVLAHRFDVGLKRFAGIQDLGQLFESDRLRIRDHRRLI